MPPKKRDKDNETSKNSKLDHLQADHELFLQAFESKYPNTSPHAKLLSASPN